MKFNFTITFPTTLDNFANPSSGDALNSPDHATQHTDANDAIEALQAKVGVNSSAVTTSHDYKLGEVTGSDKAVGKTATQTLTNKTLTSPQINMGTNATGDIYYRDSGGAFQRLPIGSASQVLQVSSGGIPEWISNPSASDASYSTKGIVKFDTDAATSGITVASGVASVNTGTSANKIVKLNGSAQLPAIDGSLLTSIAIPSQLTTPTRALGTSYQNTDSKTRLVMVTVLVSRGSSGTANNYGRATAYMDTNSTPTTVVGWVENIQPVSGAQNEDNQSPTMMLTFAVPPNSYYRVVSTSTGSGAGATLGTWTEQTI